MRKEAKARSNPFGFEEQAFSASTALEVSLGGVASLATTSGK